MEKWLLVQDMRHTDQEGLPDSTLFRKDMIHMNQDGYNLWAKRIQQALQDEEILP